MNDSDIFKYMKLVAEEFKKIRKERKLTLEDVAFDLGVSSSYIGKIENGDLKKLSFYMYIKLADYYEVNLKDLIDKAEYKYEVYKAFFDY